MTRGDRAGSVAALRRTAPRLFGRRWRLGGGVGLWWPRLWRGRWLRAGAGAVRGQRRGSWRACSRGRGERRVACGPGTARLHLTLTLLSSGIDGEVVLTARPLASLRTSACMHALLSIPVLLWLAATVASSPLPCSMSVLSALARAHRGCEAYVVRNCQNALGEPTMAHAPRREHPRVQMTIGGRQIPVMISNTPDMQAQASTSREPGEPSTPAMADGKRWLDSDYVLVALVLCCWRCGLMLGIPLASTPQARWVGWCGTPVRSSWALAGSNLTWQKLPQCFWHSPRSCWRRLGEGGARGRGREVLRTGRVKWRGLGWDCGRCLGSRFSRGAWLRRWGRRSRTGADSWRHAVSRDVMGGAGGGGAVSRVGCERDMQYTGTRTICSTDCHRSTAIAGPRLTTAPTTTPLPPHHRTSHCTPPAPSPHPPQHSLSIPAVRDPDVLSVLEVASKDLAEASTDADLAYPWIEGVAGAMSARLARPEVARELAAVDALAARTLAGERFAGLCGMGLWQREWQSWP